jgi:hypothetical protein
MSLSPFPDELAPIFKSVSATYSPQIRGPAGMRKIERVLAVFLLGQHFQNIKINGHLS